MDQSNSVYISSSVKRKSDGDSNHIHKKPCVCGSDDHQRRSSRNCPLNPQKQTPLVQLDFDEEYDPDIEIASQTYS